MVGHSRSQSLVSVQSADSIADLDLEAARQDTGITAEAIEAHIVGPNGNGRWTCTYRNCAKTFGRRENIRSHVQTHLNDRPYRCPICGNCFVRQHDLKRHNKIHLGEKPYNCMCGNGFARHDALTRHRQRGMCVGALDGAVRKAGKRGRPRKNRPQSEVSQSAVDAAILAVHNEQPQPQPQPQLQLQLQLPPPPPLPQQPEQFAQLPFEPQPQSQGESLLMNWTDPDPFWPSSSAEPSLMDQMDDLLMLENRTFDFNDVDEGGYQSQMSSDMSDASSPYHDPMEFCFGMLPSTEAGQAGPPSPESEFSPYSFAIPSAIPSSTETSAAGPPSPESEFSPYSFAIPSAILSSTETSAAEPLSPPNDLPGFGFDTSSAGTSPSVPPSPESSMSPTLAPVDFVDPTLMQDDMSILESLPSGYWT